MAVSDYSTTPGNNTSISGINIAEGCSPAGINNAIRQMMADIKTYTDALTTYDASAVAITGGTINGTAIGGSTPAAGAFTTLSATGNLTFGGTTLTDITGADTKLVSGTAGANTDFGLWNADGDLVGGSMTYTRGSLIVGGAAAWNKLAVGTSGQVLTSDGTDAVWSAPSSGLQFLSSVDFAVDATADFTLSASYDFHMFVLSNVVPDTDNTNLYIRTSTDGGSTFDSGASDYNWSWIGSISSSNAVQILNDAAATVIELAFASAGVGSAAGEDGLSGVIYVLGHHLAKQTRVMGKVVYTDSTGANRVMDIGGARLSAADVDALRFFFSTGNLESGTITHYGGKNA